MNNQNLFSLMKKDHGLVLVQSELEDIKEAVKKDEKEAENCKNCVGHDGKNHTTGCYECKNYYGNLFKKRK